MRGRYAQLSEYEHGWLVVIKHDRSIEVQAAYGVQYRLPQRTGPAAGRG
jgi:hypothetical protein